MDAVIERPEGRDVERLATFFYEDMKNLGVDTSLASQKEVAQGVVERTDPQCQCWVIRATSEGEARGVVVANGNWSIKFGGRSLWIESLYVDPQARRRGYGRRLVEFVLDWAEEHGIKGIDLEAYRGNTPASILYRSLGFYRLGRERFYYRLSGEREYL